MLALATVGGLLRLDQTRSGADPDVAAAMRLVWDLLGVADPADIPVEQKQQALGLIRSFFAEAADLLDRPDRAPGWAFEDKAILQGLGASSASLVGRIGGLAAARPWLMDRLTQPGVFLDVGTGVGGIALAAAAAWPALRVVGIDRWAPSLALAAQNHVASGYSDRVRFQHRALEDVDEREQYSVIWLATPFIAGPSVTAAMPRLLAALAQHGVLIAGVILSPAEPLAASLAELRAIRNGGQSWTCDDVARLMQDAGFEYVEIPADQTGMQFVIGRRGTAPVQRQGPQ